MARPMLHGAGKPRRAMAIRVNEIMNRELYCVKPHDRAQDALTSLLSLGLSAAPVVDDRGHPLGIVSWRDLVQDGERFVESRMSTPAITVHESASLDDA